MSERTDALDGLKWPDLQKLARANDVKATKKAGILKELDAIDGPLKGAPKAVAAASRTAEGDGTEKVGVKAPADGTVTEVQGDGQGDALPPIPEENYPPDATPLEPADATGEKTNDRGDWWCPACDHSQTEVFTTCQGCGRKRGG